MLIVPKLNAEEAAPVQGLAAYGANSLSEVVNFLRGKQRCSQLPANLILFPVRSTMISQRCTVSDMSNEQSKWRPQETIIC
jgi:predicted ATPase with chaperone activity